MQVATKNMIVVHTFSWETSKTNARRWYSSSISLCFFIVDSAIGIIGVCLNSSIGRNVRKLFGSSFSKVPGML